MSEGGGPAGEMGVVPGAMSSSVMVRHVPLMLMLSPSAASDRIVGQDVIVSEVPPPPVLDGSRGVRVEIAFGVSSLEEEGRGGGGL